MIDWLPGYEHQPINAGLDWTPGTPWKVGAHSTETGPAPGLIDAWRRNPGAGLSHFLGITPQRIVQLLPLSVGGYTAQNPPGGIDTNRAHLVQIEVCEYAIDPGAPIDRNRPQLGTREDWSDEWYEALGRWLADLDAALDGQLDLTTELTFGDQWTGFPGGGQAYVDFRGVLGHQHIPEQPDRHWDPGKLDIHRLLTIARSHTTGDDDMPSPKDFTAEDWKAFDEHVVDVINNATGGALAKHLGDVLAGEQPIRGAILDQLDPRRAPGQKVVPIRDLVEAQAALVAGDPQTIASALADVLAPEVAGEVVALLGQKLTA